MLRVFFEYAAKRPPERSFGWAVVCWGASHSLYVSIRPKFLTFRPKDVVRCFRFLYFQVSQQENFQLRQSLCASAVQSVCDSPGALLPEDAPSFAESRRRVFPNTAHQSDASAQDSLRFPGMVRSNSWSGRVPKAHIAVQC